MSSYLTRFNNQVQNLLNELMEVLPKDRDVKICNEKFNLVRGANPKIILEGFLKYVYPYKDYIVNKNEDYFLNEKIENTLVRDDNLKQKTNVDNEFILTRALNLRNLWKDKLSENNKECIWKYFQVFIILCEKYVISTTNK